MKEKFQQFGKAMLVPITLIAISGVFLGFGSVFTTDMTMQSFGVDWDWYQGTFIFDFFSVFKGLGNVIIGNLGILFAVGCTFSLSKKEKGWAAFSSVVCYLAMLSTIQVLLNAAGLSAENTTVEALEAAGMSALDASKEASLYTTVLGFFTYSFGVFGGIIVGCITGALFNRFSNKQMPIALSMFSGVRFPFLLMILVSWVMGFAFCYVWPPIQGAIGAAATAIHESGNVGLFFYGMLNKLLVPTGLHHLVYAPFQFSDVGGTLVMGDTVVTGSYPIRLAEMAMPGVPFSDSTYYNSFPFNNLWPYLGIGAAFIVTAYPKNREKTKAVMVPLMVTAVLSCITEPIDFLFVFAAPALFVIHSVISGIMLVLLHVLNVPASTAGGIINIAINNLVLGVDKTNWPVMLALGVADAVIYFFLFKLLIKRLNLHTPGREEDTDVSPDGNSVAPAGTVSAVASAPASDVSDEEAAVADLIRGLGGKGNIEALENCFTRLRVEVKDDSIVDETLINRVPNSGINRNGTDIQIIYGMQVAAMRDKVENALEKM